MLVGSASAKVALGISPAGSGARKKAQLAITMVGGSVSRESEKTKCAADERRRVPGGGIARPGRGVERVRAGAYCGAKLGAKRGGAVVDIAAADYLPPDGGERVGDRRHAGRLCNRGAAQVAR